MKKLHDAVQTQASGSKGVEHINSNSNQEKIKISKVELNRQLKKAEEFVKNEFLEHVDKWYYNMHKFADVFRYINNEAEFFKVPINSNGDLTISMRIHCHYWGYDVDFKNLRVQCIFQVENTIDDKLLQKVLKSLDRMVEYIIIDLPVPNEISKRLSKKSKDEFKQKTEAKIKAIINSSEIITAPKTNEQFYLQREDSYANLYTTKLGSVESWLKIDSELAGYIRWYDGEIKRLSVNSQFQGKGLGDILMKAAIDKGCYWLFANGNRAYKMYQKYGFVAIGEYRSQYDPIKTKEDFERFKRQYNGVTAMMCLKDKLDKFGLEWNELQKEIDEFITSKYHGMMDSIEVGDEIELSSGLKAICEDYDDNYYYLRDYNANVVKIRRKTGK